MKCTQHNARPSVKSSMQWLLHSTRKETSFSLLCLVLGFSTSRQWRELESDLAESKWVDYIVGKRSYKKGTQNRWVYLAPKKKKLEGLVMKQINKSALFSMGPPAICCWNQAEKEDAFCSKRKGLAIKKNFLIVFPCESHFSCWSWRLD